MIPALTFKTDDSHDWVKDHITLLERRRFVSRSLETNSVIMPIHGFQTLTLLDYPGYTAATVFLGGCNFRCPFCQNAGLVLHPEKEPVIAEEDILTFLKKRRRVLDGVCITGGEPTLAPDLPSLIRSIKELGYLVKLDTNGTHPAVVRRLTEEKLIDYVAMDIKSSREHYDRLAGSSSEKLLSAVEETAAFLMNGSLDYEFRTTVVRELHEEEDFEKIRDWLAGCKRYYLQAYKDSEHILKPDRYSSYSREELEHFAGILRKKIPLVEIRGID